MNEAFAKIVLAFSTRLSPPLASDTLMKNQKGSYELNFLILLTGISLAITIGMVDKGSNVLIYIVTFFGCFLLLFATLFGFFRLLELYESHKSQNDVPKRFKNPSLWWMSYPKIENRKLISEPFGDPPIFKVNEKVKLVQKPERTRKILKVEWHGHRYQWVYIIETSASDKKSYFEPYWFGDKLKLVEF